MAELTVQNVKHTGLTPSFVAAAAGGDEFDNDGDVLFYVKNGGGAEITVTINSIPLSNYGTDVDVVVAVPAASEKIIGRFPRARFNDGDGHVNATYSGVTSVTVAALRADPDGL